MVRLTDRPDMTLDVYGGCKTTTQQQQQSGVTTIALPVFQTGKLNMAGKHNTT